MGEPVIISGTWPADPPPKRPRRPAVSRWIVETLLALVTDEQMGVERYESKVTDDALEEAARYLNGMLAWIDGRKGAK
jgi:hypothetical protein